jgi:hypothetical protein
MKLRLHAGSLRLRLSQSEVACLGETGRVQDSIEFAPGSELRYTVETDAVIAVVTATFDNSNIRVSIPETVAKQWIGSDQTGIQDSGKLGLLIEKDFQCLHREPRPGEDSFPNPLANES